MNREYRPQLLEKISSAILTGDQDTSLKASLFKWLRMRRIYLIKMLVVVSDFNLTPSDIENCYVDQFRYTQHVFMRGFIRDNMAIDISRDITDHTLQSIEKHCTGLQSLNLESCGQITDVSIISMSTNCTGLQSLNLGACGQKTDASIISISAHCLGLEIYGVVKRYQILASYPYLVIVLDFNH